MHRIAGSNRVMIRAISTLSLALFMVVVWPSSLGAQRANKRPKIEILREINLEEGRQRLIDFRRMWVVGDMSLQYELQFIPRRGKRTKIEGTLWGTNGLGGPVSLIQIQGEQESQLYLQSGPFASVSKKEISSGRWNRVDAADWFEVVDEQVT